MPTLLLAARHPDEIVGVEDLAKHWNKPKSSILSDRTRAPWRVPAVCSPPGVSPLRWRVGTVLEFDRLEEEKSLQARREAIVCFASKPIVKRGRPQTGTGPKELAAAKRRGCPPKEVQLLRRRATALGSSQTENRHSSQNILKSEP